MSRRTNESLLDHCEIVESGACAPPVLASKESAERKMDRAYTEAGFMGLRAYIAKWGRFEQ